MNTAEQEHYRTLTREEHVPIVPYVLLVFKTSNNNSESLFEEDPAEFYYKTFEEGRKAFYSIKNASHLMLMKYGFNGEPEDGEVLYEWDETESCACCLCDKFITDYGNNAQPLKDGNCCSECNATKVIPARLGLIVQTES